MKNRIIKWQPEDFELEMTTHWSFPQRGDWATHDAKWRGNWSPYIPRNIILRYSQKGDLVLDQFAGGGTTLVEAKLLNRDIIGIDIKLPITCKSVFFIMQHLYYLSSGDFIPTKRELLECVQDEDKIVLELSMSLRNHADYDFDRAFSVLFNWCQNALLRL